MHTCFRPIATGVWFLGVSLAVVLPAAVANGGDDAKDWPMYNHDVIGTRHNPGETAIGRDNAGRLEEKWRFPAKGSDQEIGVIHATPIVVNGYVYFGTATDPTFYKLTPDGKVRWSYRNPARAGNQPVRVGGAREPGHETSASSRTAKGSWARRWSPRTRSISATWAAGSTRWTGRPEPSGGSSTRGPRSSPAPIRSTSSSPRRSWLDGKLIVAGGTLEQLVAGGLFYRGSTGRGFVLALEPKTGRIVWKYDVGPKPEPLSRRSRSRIAGATNLLFRAGDELGLEHAVVRRGVRARSSSAPMSTPPPGGRPPTTRALYPRVVRRSSRWTSQAAREDGSRRSTPATSGPTPCGPTTPRKGATRTSRSATRPRSTRSPWTGKPTKVVGVGCKNGGFYVLRAADGQILDHTPIYTGPPTYPLSPDAGPADARPAELHRRLADRLRDRRNDDLHQRHRRAPCWLAGEAGQAAACRRRAAAWWPSAWTREPNAGGTSGPRSPSLGGPPPKPVYTDVGDPVASGIAVANGVVYFTTVASGKLVALDAATGSLLKEIDLGPVWSGPSVSRGRVYVGTGNTLFTPDFEGSFPRSPPASSTRSACRARTKSVAWARERNKDVSDKIPLNLVFGATYCKI